MKKGKGELTDHGSAPIKGKAKLKAKASSAEEKRNQEKGNRDFKNAAHVHKHTVRKISEWLLQKHESEGTNNVDFAEMSFEEMKEIVPDQSQELDELREAEFTCVQLFAEKTNQSPLMVFCGLCLMKPLFRTERKEMLRAICDPANHTKLLELIQSYRTKFGFPPTPIHLGKLFITEALFPKAKARPSPSTGGAAQGARDDGPRKPSPVTGGEAKAPNSEKDEKDAKGSDFRWFSISWKKGSAKCKCTGNCVTGCEARKARGSCPNPASFNTGKEASSWKPALCGACKCQVPGCTNGARRPFGENRRPENLGKCFRHWVRK